MAVDIDVTELAEQYAAGATIEELALAHGTSTSAVRRHLLAARVALRAPGRRPGALRLGVAQMGGQ